MELLLNHRTVRQYLDTKIEESLLNSILECGIRASNTGNMQLYSIIVTQNEEKKNLLAPLHYNQSMVREVPVVLTICYDINRFYKWCEINQTNTDFKNLLWLLTGCIDVSLVTQNICIAAENSGLGICYLGTVLYNAPEISKVLNLPKGVIPTTTITIGYPAQIPEQADRLPLNSVVHFEDYKDYSFEDIFASYSGKEDLISSKQFVVENQKENLAQVYAEVRYKTDDNHFYSRKLYEMLSEQGFSFEV